MNLELGSTLNGQSFAPPEISELMARLTFGVGAGHADKPFIKLCEPACGAGGMMLEKGWNPVECI